MSENKPSTKNQTQLFLEEIKRLIIAKCPIIYIQTFEDSRCEKVLGELSQKGFQKPFHFFTWTATQGLAAHNKRLASEDPLDALDYALKSEGPALYLFKDLNQFFSKNFKLVRKLRDVFQKFKSSYNTLFIIGPSVDIPSDLSKEITIVEFKLPDIPILERLFEEVLKSFKDLKVELNEDDKGDFVKSALGLTFDEARTAFTRACAGRTRLTQADVSYVIEEKCKVIRQSGILDYIPIDFSMEEVGGLANLKSWLDSRSRFFTKDARNFGISPPKGVLLTGISGCGKSSCVKAISQYWKLPLMRLDMTKVYGGTIGNPEETMRQALRTVESVAPVILWLEEIEKGVAGFSQGDGGVTARIFSSFLTWMQEKESLVFVAATANEINKLPPELLRKGRFDEIFFVDLPTEVEREEIFKVHILKRRHKPEKFSLNNLAKATNGFNGAEIEQVVAAGMFEAFNEKRQFNDNDLYKVIAKTVPLSTTMSEAIKSIKRWADTRAVKAS